MYTLIGQFLTFYIAAYNFEAETFIALPFEQREINYAKMESLMTQLMTNYGAINGFSQQLPMGGFDGTLCSFAFNQFLPDGKMMRVFLRKQQAILK
jgi:hypothetical protein